MFADAGLEQKGLTLVGRGDHRKKLYPRQRCSTNLHFVWRSNRQDQIASGTNVDLSGGGTPSGQCKQSKQGEGDAFNKANESWCHYSTIAVWADLRFGIAWIPGRPGGDGSPRPKAKVVQFRTGQLASSGDGEALRSA